MWGHFDLDENNAKIDELKEALKKEEIWNDIDKATSINRELSSLERSVSEYNSIYKETEDSLELLELLDSYDDIEEITSSYESLKKRYDELEVASLLNGEYDTKSCYLEIHPGAGGTEAGGGAEATGSIRFVTDTPLQPPLENVSCWQTECEINSEPLRI